ncbi:FliM/FliN family flagellar motor switch protein [Pseudooceanicola algae]|nr:flagellar motor switch protein FliM [Pseudooceanicola algae]
MSPEKALRLALAKSADELLDLPLVVTEITHDFIPAQDFIDMLGDDALLLLLDGPVRLTGAVVLDLPVTTALVEQSTMGRVSPLEIEERALTATDAALVAPMLDDVLERVEGLLDGAPGTGWLTGYAFGVRIENKRLLGLALDAPDFHLFRITMDLGGIKQGDLILALPDRPDSDEDSLADDGASARNLSDAVMFAPAAIDAVLHRISMPLSDVSNLKVGDLLPVPLEALQQTRLETGRNHCLGKVRLGQANGLRAVRLTMADLAEARETIGTSTDSAAAFFEADSPSEAGGMDFGAPDLADTDFPALDSIPDPGGQEAGLPDLPQIDMGDGDAGDFPAMGDLPEIGDLPPMDDLPDLSDLPGLDDGEDSDFPTMGMAMPDLPDLEG